MDFIKLLRSLEDLLYEVMVMLVFYPRTLWLTVRHPQRMMDYADTELGDVQLDQYDDTLSPPLFLMVSLGIAHLFAQVSRTEIALGLPGLLASVENLLALRLLLFSLFPLLTALRLLSRLDVTLNRKTLRPPFYSQCFITAPVAMAVGLCQSVPHMLGAHSSLPGLIALSLILVWYLWLEADWFRAKLATSVMRSWSLALTTTGLALLTTAVTAILTFVALGGQL